MRAVDAHTGMSMRKAAMVYGCSYSTMREMVERGEIEWSPLRPGSNRKIITLGAIDRARQTARAHAAKQVTAATESGEQRLSSMTPDQFLASIGM